VSVGFVLAILVSGFVSLSLTPMLKSPALAEADTLARVASGFTRLLAQ